MLRKKIGLALGAGGSKGLAHIGVIKVLEQNHIPIDFIAGSSIGALIGAFYAARINILEIENLANQDNWQQLLSIFFDPVWKLGLVGGNKLNKFLESYLNNIDFSQTQIPLSIVATDMLTAEPKIINSGSVTQAVRASISVPILFQPITVDNHLLADGGMSMPVPVQAVKSMGADIVIAVNLFDQYSGVDQTQKIGLRTITNRTIEIFSHHLAAINVKDANIIISPAVGEVGMFGNFLRKQSAQKTILIGETAASAQLLKILEISGTDQKITSLWLLLRQLWKNIIKIFR